MLCPQSVNAVSTDLAPLFSVSIHCVSVSVNAVSTDLANMYKLLQPLHQGLVVLLENMEEHIKTTGLDAVRNLKQDSVSTLWETLSRTF